MEKKVLIVATVVKTHIAQFHYPTMKMLKEEGWTVEVAARNDYDNPKDCKIPYCDKYHDIPFERNPFSLGNIKVYRQLKKIIDEGHYDVVHCHTPVGGVLGRLASRKARKNGTKVFYTAHGFHFYKGAPLINWILWYPVEKICGRMTDVLITINKEDYDRASKHIKAKRVEYVHGAGLVVDKFKDTIIDRDKKRDEIGVPRDSLVILSVGELNKNKNHKIVIEALSKMKKDGFFLDYDVHYVIAGGGELKDYLMKLPKELNVDERVHVLGRRSDVAELCKASDLFVFPSLREGLGIAAVEALASGIDAICAKNRGSKEFMQGRLKELLFENNNLESLHNILKTSIENFDREKLPKEDNIKIAEKYSVQIVNSELKDIYYN